MFRARSIAGALLAAGSLLACSDASGPNISGIDPISISRIELTPALDTLWVGDTISAADSRQYGALVIGRSGALITGAELWWSTSDAAVATVSSAGRVVPTGRGTVQVRASAGKEGVATLVVAYGTASMHVSPAAVQAVVGDEVQLVAQAYNRGNAPMSGVEYRYTSSSAAVASVDWTGLMRLTGPGTATVTVTGGDQVQTVAVTSLPRQFQATSAAMLVGGNSYSCGLLPLGRAYCWGIGSAGQLGAVMGDTTCVDVHVEGITGKCTLEPLRVQGGHTFTQLTAGRAHACGLDASGAAWCWGAGPLGNGTLGGSPEPKLVTSALRFTQITAGDAHTCAVAQGGRAWCWGDDRAGQLGNVLTPARSTTPIPVDGNILFTQLAAGRDHTCGVTAGGSVYCWGGNAQTQLGSTTNDCTLVGYPCSDQPLEVAGGPYRQVAVGNDFSCALGVDGTAACWGAGTRGQLGNGAVVNSAAPVNVAGSWTSISAAGDHACAINAGGSVSCWGDYDLSPPYANVGALGATPVAVTGTTSQFASVTAGAHHSCGVATSGETYCWGSNLLGAFGDGLQTLYRSGPDRAVITPRN